MNPSNNILPNLMFVSGMSVLTSIVCIGGRGVGDAAARYLRMYVTLNKKSMQDSRNISLVSYLQNRSIICIHIIYLCVYIALLVETWLLSNSSPSISLSISEGKA